VKYIERIAAVKKIMTVDRIQMRYQGIFCRGFIARSIDCEKVGPFMEGIVEKLSFSQKKCEGYDSNV